MKQRIDILKRLLKKRRLDSLLVSYPANVSYLAGFPTQDSYLLVTSEKSFLITDFRYIAEYSNLLKDSNIQIIEINKSLILTLEELCKKCRLKTIGFEREHIGLSFYEKLSSVFSKKLIPTSNLIENLRIIKDNNEVKAIKKAINLTLNTFKYIETILKPGKRELEIAAEIERFIRLNGASNSAFDIIVASGLNSSFPHAKKTNRIIRNNEPVLFDIGVDLEGYKSDLTRVCFLGKMDAQFKSIYNIVKATQKTAISHIKAGISIKEIDSQARSFIAKKGYAECFKHSLGHGLGLETHEAPRVNQTNKDKFKEGMVITVEPAIYLTNKFGVRIEDVVLVTSTGAEVLSATSN